MKLPADALAAVWSIYDATGLRPEYLLPVLWHESGFNPALPNAAGAPYYGVAQTGGGYIVQDLHMTVEAFLAASAAQQITLAVLPHMRAIVARYGPIRSATRAFQANFLPGTLPTARGLTQIVVPFSPSKGSVYASNALDPLHHRGILVSDLALAMAHASKQTDVRDAVSRAYAMRPSEPVPTVDPVYGSDFVNPLAAALAVAAGVAFWNR